MVENRLTVITSWMAKKDYILGGGGGGYSKIST